MVCLWGHQRPKENKPPTPEALWLIFFKSEWACFLWSNNEKPKASPFPLGASIHDGLGSVHSPVQWLIPLRYSHGQWSATNKQRRGKIQPSLEKNKTLQEDSPKTRYTHCFHCSFSPAGHEHPTDASTGTEQCGSALCSPKSRSLMQEIYICT